jgi:hypothetical protein
VALQCLRSLNRLSGVSWSKDGKELVDSERVTVYDENVTIRAVQLQDEGVYRCDDGKPFELTSEFTSTHTSSMRESVIDSY